MTRLWGYYYSVYARIARMALAERGVDYAWEEVNPFDPEADNPHPFGKVPMLEDRVHRIYEATAITTYVEARCPGPRWTPEDPLARAREAQVIGIVDSYGYWPMVREVFVAAVADVSAGATRDEARIAKGMADATKVLSELEELAHEGHVLNGHLSRADLHLAPMMAYFTMAEDGAALLARHPALSEWFSWMQARDSFTATKPVFTDA